MKPLTPIAPERLRPVLEKISQLKDADLTKHHAWQELASLSPNTTLTGIEAHPSGVFVTGNNKFEAVATVYLTLSYGPNNEKSFSQSFPAHVFGTLGSGRGVKIDDIKIDTSSLPR